MGLTHLDAGVVIGVLDAHDAHHLSATQAVARVLRSRDRIAMAASAYAECLVGPSRRGSGAVATVDDLLDRLPIAIADLDADIARRAAALRATHGTLRLPGALVIATAVQHDADRLITTDRRWPSAQSLGVTLAFEVL